MSPSNTARSLPAVLLLAIALAGCTGGDDTRAEGEIEVDDDHFKPEALTVKAGTELHFEVGSGVENDHTVTIHMVGDAPTTLKMDEEVEAGQDYHFTPDAAGTYHVWCKNHGTMTGGMAMLLTVE